MQPQGLKPTGEIALRWSQCKAEVNSFDLHQVHNEIIPGNLERVALKQMEYCMLMLKTACFLHISS